MSILGDVRVLELTVAWAGPLAGKLLADLGADVIHVEHMNARGTGAPPGVMPAEGWEWGTLPEPATRSGVYPGANPGQRPWNRQAIFNKHNRNKRSLCIDLKRDEGRSIFLKLARHADVILDNYSPHVMKSLGIDYDSVQQVNPTIISISMSGYGQTGPFADRVSYGPILEAHSGLASISGEEYAPLKLGAALPDAIGGVTAAFAIAAALIQRDESGEGQFIDLSQLETYCALGGDAFLFQSLSDKDISPSEWANLSFGVPHGCYECADGGWIALAVETEEQWSQLRDLVCAESAIAPEGAVKIDRLNAAEPAHELLANWCRTRSRGDAFRELQAAGVPAYPVLNNGELVHDEHLAARRMFVEHDQVDVGPMIWPAFPVRLADGSDPARYLSAPGLGQHNEEILRELCGMEATEIQRLHSIGVLGKEPVTA